MTVSITPSMIKSITIGDEIGECYPCTHSCKIKLLDGRKVKTLIDGNELYILIQSIALEKIKGDATHFEIYRNFEGNQGYLKSDCLTKSTEFLNRFFRAASGRS